MERLFAMSDETRARRPRGRRRSPARASTASTGKIGCIGFCMGGRYTLLFACATRPARRRRRLLGRVHRQRHARRALDADAPTPPLELADRLSCPLLAAVGAEDHNPSPELAEQLASARRASGQEVKVDVYEGAGHAFFADYRPTYRPGRRRSCGRNRAVPEAAPAGSCLAPEPAA